MSSISTKAVFPTALIAALASSCPTHASAADSSLLVGVSGTYTSAEYEDVDSEATPDPLLIYQRDRLTFYPLGVSVQIASLDIPTSVNSTTSETEHPYNIVFSVTANYANEERDNDDSAVFTGMDERTFGSVAGLSAVLATPVGGFEATIVSDISGSSDGNVASLAYQVPLYGTTRFSISGAIGVQLTDERWSDYYYGVRESEATTERAAYSPSATLNSHVGYDASYMLNRHWILTQTASITKLDAELVNSPLTTDDDTRTEFSLGLIYSF